MGKQHIIELNGKQYDALSGKIIIPQATHTPRSKPTGPKIMGGVSRRPPQPSHPNQPQRRPVEKSHTLMRKTVRKPVNHKLHALAAAVNSSPVQPRLSDKQVVLKPSVKSKLIRKFSPIAPSPTVPEPADPKKSAKSAVNSSVSRTAVNAAVIEVNPLNQAIANATSHQQPKLKRPNLNTRAAQRLRVSPKIISASSAVLAVVLIAGFFSYQNIPNLKMRLASSRSGLHGTLPGYQPPGFRLNGISYKSGQINIGFHSNSDARNFTVTQVASSWNSETLRDKLKSSGQVSTPVEVPDKGKTLFIYNDSSVAWVDGGILYKIEGDSKLSSDQLLHLANSL